jgi:hypothetical protein
MMTLYPMQEYANVAQAELITGTPQDEMRTIEFSLATPIFYLIAKFMELVKAEV